METEYECRDINNINPSLNMTVNVVVQMISKSVLNRHPVSSAIDRILKMDVIKLRYPKLNVVIKSDANPMSIGANGHYIGDEVTIVFDNVFSVVDCISKQDGAMVRNVIVLEGTMLRIVVIKRMGRSIWGCSSDEVPETVVVGMVSESFHVSIRFPMAINVTLTGTAFDFFQEFVNHCVCFRELVKVFNAEVHVLAGSECLEPLLVKRNGALDRDGDHFNVRTFDQIRLRHRVLLMFLVVFQFPSNVDKVVTSCRCPVGNNDDGPFVIGKL